MVHTTTIRRLEGKGGVDHVQAKKTASEEHDHAAGRHLTGPVAVHVPRQVTADAAAPHSVADAVRHDP